MAAAHATLVFLLALSACVLSERDFVRTPAFNVNKRITATLKRSIELSCEYKGSDDNVEFTGWYRNDSNVDQEIPGHYVVKNHKHYTNLTIKIFVHNDSYVQTWTAKAKKNNAEIKACEFNKIVLIPSPQSIETDRTTETVTSSNESIRRVKDEPILLKCNIEPAIYKRNSSGPTWQFSADGETFTDLPAGVVSVRKNEIKIDRVQTIHRGHYRCKLNGVSFQVLLRVKDHLAALWPFLGIVTVVVLLVLLILVCERRQKATRRTVGTDDEHLDHTKDPLVRAANNASDNENKKRAIKA